MQGQPHRCTYEAYGCGHGVIAAYCSSSNRQYPEYRGGLTAHGQRATISVYTPAPCPNCKAKARAADLARYAPAVG